MVVRVAGVGIHSGAKVVVHLHRCDARHYIHFRRNTTRSAATCSSAKRSAYLIPAHVDYVRATPRCTVLGLADIPDSYVSTVEHLLAACAIAGWWRGLLIEVQGSELPILDGSAQEWFDALGQLGAPPAVPTAYRLKHRKQYRLRHTRMVAKPAPEDTAVTLRLESSIDFPQAVIGQQRWQGSIQSASNTSLMRDEDATALLRARTFGFVEELELLHKHGFALGASLDNVLVFSQTDALVPLRYANEPVRHKALDALGDFLLLGRPLHAAIVIHRGSHQAHVAFVKQLLRRQHYWLEQLPSVCEAPPV